MRYVSHNLNDTRELAKRFANSLCLGDVVLLNGDLGAGKTTFTQFVFENLGVKEQVLSPTFAIMKSYNGKFRLYHFDAYRITTEEAIEAGFDEILSNRECVIFVEWSENILPLLPPNCKHIDIKWLDDTSREFKIDE